MRSRKPIVYVAGPFTHGDVVANLHSAIDAAEQVLREGCMPFVPHLNMLWDVARKHSYEFWLRLDFSYLDRCDALLRVPGYSPGADREVKRARANGQPVFKNITQLRRWKRGQNGSSKRKDNHPG